MDVGDYNGCRLYTGHRLELLDYRLSLGTPTSASHALSAVAELLVWQSELLYWGS